MRYAIGLSMIGGGALLIYGGFTDQSVWGMVRSALTGLPYEPRGKKVTGVLVKDWPKPGESDGSTGDPLPRVSDPLGNGVQVA